MLFLICPQGVESLQSRTFTCYTERIYFNNKILVDNLSSWHSGSEMFAKLKRGNYKLNEKSLHFLFKYYKYSKLKCFPIHSP